MGTAVRGGSVVGYRAVIPYVGPGDIVTGANGWWGLRAYSAAASGSNAVRLRRDSDNSEQNFVVLSTGALDVASIATFKGAANLFVSKLYDQTGNGNDLIQITAAAQPGLTLAGLGSLPVMTYVSASSTQLQTSTLTIPTICTLSAVANRTGARAAILNWTNPGPRMDGSNPNQWFLYNNTNVNVSGVADNTWHAAQFVYRLDATTFALVDSNTTTGDAGSGTATTPFSMGSNGFDVLDGQVVEGGHWPLNFSSTQAANMNSNQHTYWGF